jgi:hypothetical protein
MHVAVETTMARLTSPEDLVANEKSMNPSAERLPPPSAKKNEVQFRIKMRSF